MELKGKQKQHWMFACKAECVEHQHYVFFSDGKRKSNIFKVPVILYSPSAKWAAKIFSVNDHFTPLSPAINNDWSLNISMILVLAGVDLVTQTEVECMELKLHFCLGRNIP